MAAFSIKITGPAGSGVKYAGLVLSKSLVHSGYYIFSYLEYNSLIRGGHNTYQINIHSQDLPITLKKPNLLICLAQKALENEKGNITDDTIVLCHEDIKIESNELKKKNLYQPELKSLAQQAGNPLTLNTAFIAFLVQQLNLDVEYTKNLIAKGLARKGEEIVSQNNQAFDLAFNLSQKYHLSPTLPANNSDKKILITGSEAIALGAMASGINLFSAYPMTPATPTFQYLAKHQEKGNFLVYHTEDEISAINVAIGASFTGAKSMTGTSGGGFALMQESVSLAGMLELPLVIYLAQRPGPATGLPTRTSQGDLLFTINSGHGEFPKIVLAPSSPKDAYLLTHKAFSLSQKYQCPVIILYDKYLAESLYTIKDLPSLDPVPLLITTPTPPHSPLFPRYKYETDKIQLRTLPGMKNGEYIANSDEHDASGLVDESAPKRQAQNKRRKEKLALIKRDIPLPQADNQKTDTAIITWGSHQFIGQKIAANFKNAVNLHFTHLWPLPEGLTELLKNYSRLIAVENNATNQFARLITQETGVKFDRLIGLDDGRPIDPPTVINLSNDHG